MRISICVGNYATTPYRIEGLDQVVYDVEELCYCMKENAFLLDDSLMDDALADWIFGECGLKELARELYPLIHKKGSLSSFVTLIMEYVGFYDTQAIHQVAQSLKQGQGLSGLERRKTQIDHLVTKGKYVAALRGYDALLSQWDEFAAAGQVMPGTKVQANLYHNKGVAFSRLMLYELAGECFLKAYRITGEDEEYMAYLGTHRMRMNDNEYVAFASGDPEHFELTLALEKRMDGMQEEFQKQPEYEKICLRKTWREGNEKQSYYEENERLIQAFKNSYRENVGE